MFNKNLLLNLLNHIIYLKPHFSFFQGTFTMAWRRNQFQGQFGINETPLTIAIENGNFKGAEEIIQDTNDPSFLNDGPYENIPLHMVLTNNHHTDQSRNLRIAKLLVQKGANPNLRIPYGDMDRASPSPFEELVVYHEVLKSYVDGSSEILCEELDMYFELEEIKLEFITNTVDFDGVKCIPNIENCHKLIKETSDLIDVFLEYGSDPNVFTTFAHKTLFHWVTEHEDVVLAKRFLDTCRVNLNVCDIHGNSPLMDTILRNDPENSLHLYEAMCDTVDYIDVNAHNCCGETALFRAVFVGAVDVASRLCTNGANIKTKVCVSQVPISYRSECSSCASSLMRQVPSLTTLHTPLLAPLLADAPTRLRYSHVPSHDIGSKIIRPHKHLIDKIILSSISPLIDLGCFSDQPVVYETAYLLTMSNFSHLLDYLSQTTNDLILLMFGQVSAGLRQLCIRSLFDYIFMVSQIPKKTWPDLVSHDICLNDCKGALVESYMTDLVELLGLPQSFKIFFDIEAGKYQICKLIMGLQSVDCDQACSVSEESMFDDDEDDDELFDTSVYSSDYGESLLFFSSDMLSEESSEEVEDLSDEDFSGTEEEEKDKVTEGAKKVDGEMHEHRRVKCDHESLSSESENVKDIVESFCEDLAEDVAHHEHSSECYENYQRFSDESTASSELAEDFTASGPVSDSSC